MFNTWRSEKKIKVVFEMQFHATQVPQLRSKTLTISLIPEDVGKPTVRLGKAALLEGTCSWENPVYETVKFIKQTKTGKIKGKIYHFIVSAGSSKTGFLGEASVDFADLFGTTKPVMLSLPLRSSNSGAILHVTIQNLEGALDQRYFAEHGDPTTKSGNVNSEMDMEDTSKLENRNLGFIKEEHALETAPHHPEQNGNLRDPQYENYSPYRDFTATMWDICQRVSSDGNSPYREEQQRSNQDRLFRSTYDGNVIDTNNSPTDNFSRISDHEASENVNARLINQIRMLERQAEVSELELQSLKKQILKESRKVQESSTEIVGLKKERDAPKAESGEGKPSLKSINEGNASNNPKPETENLNTVPEEFRKELQQQKQLNRKLRFQLQKAEDSNSELILAVRDLKEKLNKKNREMPPLSSKNAKQNDLTVLAEACKSKMDQDAETKVLEKPADEVEVLKQVILNLKSEMELSRKEKDEIELCMQQLNVECEVLKKEKTDMNSDLEKKQTEMQEIQHEISVSLATVKKLKLQEERLEEEIRKQALLSSESLITINQLETQIKSLEEELKKQAQNFEDDLTAVTQAMVKQEERAIQAEEALTKANWSNADSAEHLKEDFRRISEEMASKINKYERLATKAATEENALLLKNEILEKLVQKSNDELTLTKDEYETKLQDLSDRLNQRWTGEKEELEREVALARKETEKLFQENITLRSLIDERKKTGEIFKFEMEKLRVQINELKHSSLGTNLENENLKKQIVELQQTLHNKQQEIRQFKDVIIYLKTVEERKSAGENMPCRELGLAEVNTAEIGLCRGSQKSNGTHSRRALKLDNGQTNNISDPAKLLNEVTSLKERNKEMAGELIEMQERYSEISLKFAEVEGERQQLVMTLRNLKNDKKHPK